MTEKFLTLTPLEARVLAKRLANVFPAFAPKPNGLESPMIQSVFLKVTLEGSLIKIWLSSEFIRKGGLSLSGNVSPENISPLGLFFHPLSGSTIKIGKALSAVSVTSRTFANWYCFHQNQTPDPNTPQSKQTETRSKMFFCFKFIEFLLSLVLLFTSSAVEFLSQKSLRLCLRQSRHLAKHPV